MAITGQPAFVTDGFVQSLAEYDAHIFDHVVSINFQIAGSFHMNINHAVPSDLGEHVIKKRQSGIKMTGAIAVEIDAEVDLSFGGVPINGSLTHVVLSSLEILFGKFASPQRPLRAAHAKFSCLST